MKVRGVPVERAMFIVMAVLFGLALIEGNPVLVFHTAWGLALAVYLATYAHNRTSERH